MCRRNGFTQRRKERRQVAKRHSNSSLRPGVFSLRLCVKKLFLAGRRRLSVVALVAASIALANACRLAAQTAKVVKLRSSDATSFHEIDMIDDGCVQRKYSLDADAKTRLSHSDRFARAAMFARDHHTLKSLQSLFGLGFFNPNVYANRIAWLKFRNVITQLRLFNFIQSVHCSMLLKIFAYSFSKSGRLLLVFAIAASLRQRSISA